MSLDERKLSEDVGMSHARDVGVYELTGIIRGLAHIILGKNPSKGDREECLELCKLAGVEIEDMRAAAWRYDTREQAKCSGTPDANLTATGCVEPGAGEGPASPLHFDNTGAALRKAAEEPGLARGCRPTQPLDSRLALRNPLLGSRYSSPASAQLTEDPLVAGLVESRPPQSGAARPLTGPIQIMQRDLMTQQTSQVLPPSDSPSPGPTGTQPEGDSRRDVSDRKGVIGGSDWGDVYAIPPFGCRRRLAFRFEGQVDELTGLKPAVMRGKALEPIVLTMAGAVHDQLVPAIVVAPWWGFHADGYRMVDGKCQIVEAKVVGKWSADNMRKNGPTQGYQLQCQAGMHTYGLDTAVLAVLDVESWKLDEYQIKYDEPTVEQMIAEGEKFVQEVAIGALAEPFEPDSKACKGCAFWSNCHTT